MHVSTGLHTAHEAVDVVHQKLRKTVSDISSSLRPPSAQDLSRRATVEDVHRRGGGGGGGGLGEDASRRPTITQETSRKHASAIVTLSSEEHPGRRQPAPDVDQRRQHSTEESTSTRKVMLEEVGRKATLEERLGFQGEERQRAGPGASSASLSRAQALYKSESKSSMSETELKVRVARRG